MRPVAIFDIDGTIFRSSLLIELFNELVRQGTFKEKFTNSIRHLEEKWLNRQGHYDDYLQEMVDVYLRAIIGKKRSGVVQASRRIVQKQKFRTYRYTRELLNKLRNKYFTIAISGSPLEVVMEYNRFLKFDKLYGSEFGVDEKGRYTKNILHVPSRYKKEVITRYVSSHSLSLRNSIGIGDTESDVGFLELVSKPIAFNPNTKLAEVARRKNWTVVIERKDLIVEFKPKEVKYLKV